MPEQVTVKIIRIFISSPGDVQEERERARDVINLVRRRYAGRLELQAVLWEQLPLNADMSFQQGIDAVLSENGVDIAIFILWSRLGSPTGELLTDDSGKKYRSGTEREWDLMLRARERCRIENASTIRPSIIVYTRKDDGSFEERLRGKSDDEKSFEIDQKRALAQFISEEFQDTDTGVNVRAYHSFDRPTTFAQQLRIHLTSQLDAMVGELAAEPIWKIEEKGPPFRGLEVFEFEHAPVFFGREDEIVNIRTRLREQACRGCAFVLITGPSGSGKSSLARAGVLPDVCNFELDNAVGLWRKLIVKPSELGKDLVQGMVTQLMDIGSLPELAQWKRDLQAGDIDNETVQAERFAGWLSKLELRLADALKSIERSRGEARLILLVDQLEELFSDKSRSTSNRDRFFEMLEVMSRSGFIWIVATVRSDFYHYCQSVPALGRMKDGNGQYDLMPPTLDALLRIITGPAALAGLKFEQKKEISLSNLILREALEHKELLPLVEDLLRELCEHRSSEGELTFDHFMKVGGVEGSLKNRCESTYRGFSPKVQNELEDLLCELVTFGVEGQDAFVRRNVALSHFEGEIERAELINGLVKARLLTTSKDAEGNRVVYLTHESLLRVWPRAVEWLSRNVEFLRLRATIELSFKRWVDGGRHPSLLLPAGLLLEEGRKLIDLGGRRLSPALSDFIERSVAQDDEIRRRAMLLRSIQFVALSIASIVFAILGIYAQRQARYANAQKNIANENARTAQDQSKNAIEQKHIAEIERERAKVLLEKQIEGRKELSKTLFELGQKDYDAGRLSMGTERVFQAWKLRPDDVVKVEYGKAFVDQLTRADRSLIELRHSNAIISLDFSSDGTRLVTASYDNSAQLWDAITGEPIGQPMKHEGRVNEVAFSPDGTRVATASDDNSARIWDGYTGEELGQIILHERGVNSIAFSPDSMRLATASDDSSARLWDAYTGLAIGRPMLHEGPIGCVVFSPEGQRVATASFDNTARLWDVSTSNMLGEPMTHDYWVVNATFSADGRRLATASYDGTARLWDASSGKPLSSPMRHMGWVNKVIFSPDNTSLVTGSVDKTARLWDANTCEPIGQAMMHEDGVNSIAFSPDGVRIATASIDGTARQWNAKSGEQLGQPMRHEGSVSRVVFSPDGTHIATASWNGTSRIWATISDTAIVPMIHQERVRIIVVSPDGKRVCTVTDDNLAQLWDARMGEKVSKPIRLTDKIKILIFSPDGTKIATACDDKSVQVWDVSTGLPLGQPMRHASYVTCLAFSPDGKRLATASEYSVLLWNASTGELLLDSMKHEGRIRNVAFSPDGERIGTASDDKSARVWDVGTGRSLGKPMKHERFVYTIAFSPDGVRVATASHDTTAQLWDATTGEPLGETMKHKMPAGNIVFSPDGTRVATASYDKTVRLWDGKTGAPIGQPIVHLGSITSVTFSPDGMHLWTVDGSIRIWDALTSMPLGEPRQILGAERISGVSYRPDGTPTAVLLSSNTALLCELDPELSSIEAEVLFRRMNSLLTDNSEWEYEKLNRWLMHRHHRTSLRSRAIIASQSLKDKNWFAALFHLPWLCENDTTNKKWSALLAQARSHRFADLGQFHNAIGAARHWIELEPTAESYWVAVLQAIKVNDRDTVFKAVNRLREFAILRESNADLTAIITDTCVASYPDLPWQEIHAIAQESQQLQPDNASWSKALGASFYRLGKWEDAKTALLRYLGVGGTNPTAAEGEHKDTNGMPPDSFSDDFYAHAFLAMANKKLGDLQSSTKHRSILARIEQETSSLKIDWQERIRRELLSEEIEQICDR